MSRSLEANRRRNKIDRRNRLRKLKPQSIVFGRMLGQHFPALFTPMTAVPLAIGIHDEIKAAVPAVPVDVLTRFLRFWTSRPVYLQALAKPDAERLFGSEACADRKLMGNQSHRRTMVSRISVA